MSRYALFLFLLLLPFALFAASHDLKALQPGLTQGLPVMTGNGSAFTAAWYERGLYGFIVASSVVNAYGNPIENKIIAVDSNRGSSIAIAHSPSEALVAWVTWTEFDSDVFAERLSPSGMPMGPIHVAFAKGHISNVAVSWNGSRYFVVWSNGAQLLGAFVAPDGSSTTPGPLFNEPVLNGQPPAESVIEPDVAWDGQHFVVVFGELPIFNCGGVEPCPVPDTDQFRVMRVSADGVPLEISPLVIPGWHRHVHVASSGAESLLALDADGVSAIIAHTESGLTLGPETPIFRWFSDASSAVVWDGAMYTVGWRYVGDDRGPSWLGAARVSRSGLPSDYRFTATSGPSPNDRIANRYAASWGRPSMAVTDAGTTALTILEWAGPSSFRARLYLASELAPMPAPPPAPSDVVSSFGGSTARIDWQSDDAATGFAIDAWFAPYKTWWVYRTLSGDARTVTVYPSAGVSTSIGTLFRVRAFGPGGVSEGTITSIGSQRRRAARP